MTTPTDPADVTGADRAKAAAVLAPVGFVFDRGQAEGRIAAALAAGRSEGEAAAWDAGFAACHEWWMAEMDGRPADQPSNPYAARRTAALGETGGGQ